MQHRNALDRFSLNFENLKNWRYWKKGSRYAVNKGVRVNDNIRKELYNHESAVMSALSSALAAISIIRQELSTDFNNRKKKR